MQRFMVMAEELKRYSVLHQVVKGIITVKEASRLLGLSSRQTKLWDFRRNLGIRGMTGS